MYMDIDDACNLSMSHTDLIFGIEMPNESHRGLDIFLIYLFIRCKSKQQT